jgi:ribosomal protein L28
MAQICQICGKSKFKVGRRIKTRSKYNPTHTYFQKPNLQWFILSNGKRIKICTKCRKKIIKKGMKI